ncbi:cytochrome c [Bradyrhizobium jicamae]|uniref:Cytochrome c n=1 Tax=Bradyrhizobium jicamae TaxID=280332 RepID=A0ABS5FDX3_9BRAD|nr:cytochrome c [Bradyrhizobium jicamae]MBR0795004.1 cytochrome c [Bradyrhizobium jicamae]
MGRASSFILGAGRCLTGALVLGAALTTDANADQEQGRRLARLYCARCHSIDKVSRSPLKLAPPFRTLHERYPVETLQEALAEGIVTGHPTMPEFSFEADQVNDFILFLKSLEDGRADR